MKLNLRRRFRKGYRSEAPESLVQPIRPNQAWSADFMSDALYDGRAFRTFNVIDDYNREALRIEVDISLTAARVIRVLEQLVTLRGRPERLRVDRGPEFTSAALAAWCGAALAAADPTVQPAGGGAPLLDAFDAEAVFLGRVGDVRQVDRHGWTVDTTTEGNSNQGHEFGTGLEQADKDALLAYLRSL